MQFSFDRFFEVPGFDRAEQFENQGDVQPIFYDCGNWRGRPVKAFAWIGFPKNCADQKVPGMILVHGGGGTAFAHWVELWNSRGYAAIAMDNCGGLPFDRDETKGPNWPRHEFSGPGGWGNFGEVDLAPEEQWPYLATSSVIAAVSLLRSFPQVDAERIGITGVSWGGVLTCMASGFDSRLAFAAPVYGCGHLNLDVFDEHSQIAGHPEKDVKWSSMWDPSHYLKNASIPFLWVTGTNDFAFSLSMMLKSANDLGGKSRFALRVRMDHGHGAVSEAPEEIHNFANFITGHGSCLKPAEISLPRLDGGNVLSNFSADWQTVRAELNYTTDGGIEKERKWNTIPADVCSGVVSALAPSGATEMYFNLFSESGLMFSSAPLFI